MNHYLITKELKEKGIYHYQRHIFTEGSDTHPQ